MKDDNLDDIVECELNLNCLSEQMIDVKIKCNTNIKQLFITLKSSLVLNVPPQICLYIKM